MLIYSLKQGKLFIDLQHMGKVHSIIAGIQKGTNSANQIVHVIGERGENTNSITGQGLPLHPSSVNRNSFYPYQQTNSCQDCQRLQELFRALNLLRNQSTTLEQERIDHQNKSQAGSLKSIPNFPGMTKMEKQSASQ